MIPNGAVHLSPGIVFFCFCCSVAAASGRSEKDSAGSLDDHRRLVERMQSRREAVVDAELCAAKALCAHTE